MAKFFDGDKPVRAFMDGIDWQHHIGADLAGVQLFPDVASLKEGSPCIVTGGCGVVEVEVKLIRWVEPQKLKYRDKDGNPVELGQPTPVTSEEG